MTTVKVFAPAKINLTLHITGQRDDGYHLLDSLVTFAPVADRLDIHDSSTLSLTVEGPEAAGVPADMQNLALKAAALVSDAGALVLSKHLPAASGIGGGSADAAAALRGMIVLSKTLQGVDWQSSTDDDLMPFVDQVLQLGADIPMCLLPKPCRVRGIGQEIEFTSLPQLPAVLVNPRVPVSTAAVFKALTSRDNAPMPDILPSFADAGDLTRWLLTQRNDLEAPAIEAAPVIAEVLEALRGTEFCQLARMSGSGATCFAIFPDKDAAIAASQVIAAAHPDWWLASGNLGDQMRLAEPKVS